MLTTIFLAICALGFVLACLMTATYSWLALFWVVWCWVTKRLAKYDIHFN
jgi:hypothetical protein